MSASFFKDSVLNELAVRHNVAQFVSFSPKLEQRFCLISEFPRNHRFLTNRSAIETLLSRSAQHSVNIRSYNPESPKSKNFVYGRASAEEALLDIQRFADDGLFTIVNETIDVGDGGVSGVALGGTIEFAPDDTPRCVEKPGTAAFERVSGTKLLGIVYGFRPGLDVFEDDRVEFSLHPLRRGFRREHTVIWERERVPNAQANPSIRWPNKFSQLVGDKAFGLLVGHIFGLSVPRTIVFSRRIAPFAFGESTNNAEGWLRTAPSVQTPGKFTTLKGWADPFALMQKEDPEGTQISSVLRQASVDARFSGAAAIGEQGEILVEGVAGDGDKFMLGEARPEPLPETVRTEVSQILDTIATRLGSARIEWVADQDQIWIVQLHKGFSSLSKDVVVPGERKQFVPFYVKDGLENLRELISQLKDTDSGIRLVGGVGVLSHFGDTLRKAGIPSFITHEGDQTVCDSRQSA